MPEIWCSMTISNLKFKAIAAHLVPGLLNWIKNDLSGLVREMRWSYLPPLMVYFAAGISGFTGIIESFFVKEAHGLSAGYTAWMKAILRVDTWYVISHCNGGIF